MNYDLEISDWLNRQFGKLAKKDKKQLQIIWHKVQQILENPYHFKPLRGDMHGARRVHIDKSFVLTYDINESKKLVRLLNYDHHDKIY